MPQRRARIAASSCYTDRCSASARDDWTVRAESAIVLSDSEPNRTCVVVPGRSADYERHPSGREIASSSKSPTRSGIETATSSCAIYAAVANRRCTGSSICSDRRIEVYTDAAGWQVAGVPTRESIYAGDVDRAELDGEVVGRSPSTIAASSEL